MIGVLGLSGTPPLFAVPLDDLLLEEPPAPNEESSHPGSVAVDFVDFLCVLKAGKGGVGSEADSGCGEWRANGPLSSVDCLRLEEDGCRC